MLTVELQQSVLALGDFVYQVVASISLHNDGRVEIWDPSDFAKQIMQDPIPWRFDDGKVCPLYFRDDPATWLRHLGFMFRSGDTVPVTVRDDDAEELTRAEVAARLGVMVGTWSGYVSRSQAPAPTRWVGKTPLWSAKVIDEWQGSRRGRGRVRQETVV